MDIGTFGWKGEANRSFEFPGGSSTSVSPTGRARIRYNEVSMMLEASLDGGAYVVLSTGGGVSPWVEAGAVIRQVNVASQVVVGAALPVGAEQLRIVGDTRIDSTLSVSNLTTPSGSGTDLGITSDTGKVEVTVGALADAFGIVDFAISFFSVNQITGGVRAGARGSAINAGGGTVSAEIDTAEAAAFSVVEGVNSYLIVDTTIGSESVSIGGTTTVPPAIVLDATALVTIPDDSAGSLVVSDGTNQYLGVDTTNGSESVTIGNSTTNPDIIFDTSGDVSLGSSPLCLPELGADPAAVANNVKLYAKDVAAVSQLFARSDDGTVHQLTPVGGTPGGANTQVQYNSAGAFAGDADFTFDGTNVTLVNALFADGGVTTSAATALNIGTATATSVAIGSAVASVTVSILDNTAAAFRVTQGAVGYIDIDTTNVSEKMDFGNATTNPDYEFLGSGGVTINGKLTVVGAIDPPSVSLSGGTALFYESDDGSTAPVAGATSGRIRYNDGTAQWEASVQGGAYAALGGTAPGGANTQVQYNSAGSFAGDADFTFDGTNVTLANALFADGGVTTSAATALNIGTATATSVAIGSAVASVTVSILDNTASAFRVTQGALGYIDIDTTNGSEAMIYGNNVSLVTHKFLIDGADASAFTVQDNSGYNVFRADTASKVVHVSDALYSCSITVRNATIGAYVVQDAAGIDLFNWSTVDDSLTIQNAVNNGNTRFFGTGTVQFDGPVHVEALDNNANAFRVRESAGSDVYINVDTTNGAEVITLGNATTNPLIAIEGSGGLRFDNSALQSISVEAAAATIGGVDLTVVAGAGGAATAGAAGGVGAILNLDGAAGGVGSAAQLGGNGGDVIVTGGVGGATGGGGAGNGASVRIRGGAGDANGSIHIGDVTTTGVGFFGATPVAQSSAYTRNATIVEDRTLLASASATTLNNNNVLAALIADLQAIGILG